MLYIISRTSCILNKYSITERHCKAHKIHNFHHICKVSSGLPSKMFIGSGRRSLKTYFPAHPPFLSESEISLLAKVVIRISMLPQM